MDERLKRLYDSVYTTVAKLDATAYITAEPNDFLSRRDGKKLFLSEGDRWGKLWDCAWMNFQCDIPEGIDIKKAVFLLDVGGEGCVFDRRGNPFCGITNKESFYSFELGIPAKLVVPYFEGAIADGRIDLWVDCGANDLFGERRDASFEPIGVLHTARIALCNEKLRRLYYDLEVILYFIGATEDETLKQEAITCCDAAFSASESNADTALEITKAFLAHKSESDFRIYALGHAHIDLAWLWPIRETKRKAARTFATVIRNSEKYPEYLFGVSQPQMLYWVKCEHPELYDELKTLYNNGRLELQGGFWVESDTNIPCGESLMRQMLYGKKYFKEEFGFEEEILWIPDVFGYCAQLPQIMRHCGVKYFLTIKMSWNSVNLFPYSTFNWIGLDGSRVLTHMPPEGNYNSSARAESFLNTERKHRERAIDNRAMLLYGIGDGGGGPGEEHLERLRREYDLRGLPKAKQSKAIDFFRDIEKDFEKFPSYSGELYLEKHQGTYTTQAKNKKNNRLCENALHDCELLCLFSHRLAGAKYPKDRLEAIWKELLLYQFHDIIPGSSIKRVYDETDERYAVMLSEIAKLEAEALDAVASGGEGCLFNPSSYAFRGYVKDENGYVYAEVSPLGFAKAEQRPVSEARADENSLENEHIRVTFSQSGSIVSVCDKKSGFEYLRGDGNLLTVYEDNENAWEVPPDYAQNAHTRLEAQSVDFRVTDGVAERTTVYAYGESVIIQTAVLAPESARIDFRTNVTWRETNRMLRVAFPVSITDDNAKCGIQYGNIDRPTHRRDSFAKAKKEICAHGWVDISDNAHGVALLSDCKFGYRVWDCVLDLDLLRSSMYPGVDADKGEHEFTYSLFVHNGSFENGVQEQSAFVCYPTRIIGKAIPERLIGSSLAASSKEGVVIDALKLSEDESGIIVRAHESRGRETISEIALSDAFGWKTVSVCDGCENIIGKCDKAVCFKPFEIKTLKFE